MDKNEHRYSKIEEFLNQPSDFSIGVLTVVLVALISLIAYGVFHGPFAFREKPAKTVDAFLSTLEYDDAVDVKQLKFGLKNYFDTEDTRNGLEFGDDFYNFYAIFDIYTMEVDHYDTSFVSNNYVELIPCDADGFAMYPRIAFAYKLNNANDKIQAYTIGRLQPFSLHDVEYSDKWN